MAGPDEEGLDNLTAPAPVQLEKLGQDVWICHGQSTGTAHAGDPDDVLLFSWMDARMSHILKYASEYRKMFPATAILVIETHSSFFCSSNATRKRTLHPVIQRINADTSAKRLVHAFSNGGSSSLAALAGFLAEQGERPASPSLPIVSLILDSCPGGTDLAPACKAFTMGVSPLAKYPVYVLLTCLWVSLYCYDHLIASEPGHILKMRRDLNDLEFITKSCPRLYLYSDADELVPAHWVEEHAAEARKIGFPVSVELFKGSAHVSHARTDGPKYWAAVQRHWSGSLSDVA